MSDEHEETTPAAAPPARRRATAGVARAVPSALDRAAATAISLGDVPRTYKVWQYGTWDCDGRVYQPGAEVQLTILQVEAYGNPRCLELQNEEE